MKTRRELKAGAACALVMGLLVATAPARAQDAGAPAAAPAAPAAPAVSESGAPDASPNPLQVTPGVVSGETVPSAAVPGETSPATATAGETQVPATTTASASGAGCFLPPAGVQPSEIDAFVAEPNSLLEDYGASTVELSGRVRSLVGSSPRALDTVAGLVPTATDAQKAGIGAGLGRAAFACIAINPTYASEIQARVAELQSPALLTAFLAASNDIQVAALGATGGPGGGAAAAGLAGGGFAGPNSAGMGGDDVVAQQANSPSGISRSITIIEDNGNDDDNCDRSVSPFCVD